MELSINLIRHSDIGVSYKGKQILNNQADVVFNHTNLKGILYLQIIKFNLKIFQHNKSVSTFKLIASIIRFFFFFFYGIRNNIQIRYFRLTNSYYNHAFLRAFKCLTITFNIEIGTFVYFLICIF